MQKRAHSAMLHKKIEREHYEQIEKFYRKVTNVKLLEETAAYEFTQEMNKQLSYLKF